MKSTLQIILIVVVVLLALAAGIALIGYSTYTGVMSAEESVYSAKSNITVQEKARLDTYKNQVDTIVRYASHEQITLTGVTEARGGLAKGDTTSAQILINAVAEAYPEIKADVMFAKFNTTIEATERLIAQYRENYTTQVRNYNKKVRNPITKMIIGMFDYEVVRFEYLNFEGLEDAPTNLWDE